jgi:hypothetical protein
MYKVINKYQFEDDRIVYHEISLHMELIYKYSEDFLQKRHLEMPI